MSKGRKKTRGNPGRSRAREDQRAVKQLIEATYGELVPAFPLDQLTPGQQEVVHTLDVQSTMWCVGTNDIPDQVPEMATWLVLWMLYSPDAGPTRTMFFAQYGTAMEDATDMLNNMVEVCHEGVENGTFTKPLRYEEWKNS
jgi:hypothetical protein